jgi:hypothetical protein
MLKTITDSDNHTVGKLQVKGPVSYGTIRLAPYGIQAQGLKCKYKKGKPYLYCKSDLKLEERVAVQLTDGSWTTIVKPSSHSLISGFLDSDPFTNLDEVLSESDFLAWQDAVSNSMEYGNLLLMVSALEAGDTMKMVRLVFVKLFNVIMDLYKACKKLNIVATYDILADLWLEWRYGWRPFIGELTAMYDLITADKLYKIKSSYGGHSVSLEEPIALTPIYCFTSEGRTFKYEPYLDFSSVATKVGFNYSNTSNSRNDSIWAQLGLDAESLLSTAWDLIPFSFIVDMFLNVSQIIQAPSQENEVSTFNDYVSRLIHSPRLLFKCTSIDGAAPTELPYPYPDIDLITRFRDCKKLESSYWEDPVSRLQNLKSDNPLFQEMSLVERSFGCYVISSDGGDPVTHLVEKRYTTSGYDCDGKQVEDNHYFGFADNYFIIQKNRRGQWITFWNDTITEDHLRLLQRYTPDDTLESVKKDFAEFIHVVTEEDLAPFISAFRAELDALQPYDDYYEFSEEVSKLNMKYWPLRASNYGQENDWYIPMLIGYYYTLGRLPQKGDDIIIDDNLDITLESLTIMERKLRKTDQKDRWELTTELNPKQWADIAIIGEKLVRGRLKYNQIN